MSAVITVPKYEAHCKHCGHTPGVHTTSSCANIYRTLSGEREALCDCGGWEHDPRWPPPVVVKDPAP